MTALGSVIILTALLASTAQSAPIDRFYVAPNGSDKWSGKLAAPNKTTTDGPLATLVGARDAIRRIKTEQGGLKRAITVQLRAGTYFLDKPFELASDDTGTKDCPITYEAYTTAKGVERVVISGGSAITGFAPATANGHDVIAASVPGVKQGKWYPDQLFVNDSRADRTRLPKQGWYTIKSAPLGEKWNEGQDSFAFNDGEIESTWRNLSDVDVVVLTKWIESRMPVKSVDESTQTVHLTKPSRFWLASDLDRNKGGRYYLENVLEALDAPGQWYLDRSDGRLYYYPLPGEDWRKAAFFAPRLERLVRITGTAEKPVEYVGFRNLRFAHTQYILPPDSSGSSQAAVEVPGAIYAAFARNVDLDHCEISNIGTYAIEFGAGCSRNTVRRCSIHDVGAGGIKIGHGSERTTVSDSEICDGGKIFPSAVGVWIGGSPHNRVVHNSIHDLDYTGVSVGWSWGYAESGAIDNLIASNHIHHIGRGVLSDLGGIYTLGVSPGTILRNNLIHDCQSFSYGGWGIYTDEGSTGILIEDNVVYRTKTGGFHQHYGKENTLTNNIFAFAANDQLQRTRNEPHISFTFERNIVYYDTGALLGSNWGDDNYKMDYNLYWDASGRPVTFSGASLEDWRKRGHDQHSLVADPLFVDPSKDDFRLKPDSPAFKTRLQTAGYIKRGTEGGRRGRVSQQVGSRNHARADGNREAGERADEVGTSAK